MIFSFLWLCLYLHFRCQCCFLTLQMMKYIERIEEKYPIKVVENYDGHVVYNDGKCVAVKLPYDELERIGCGEFSEKLVEN